MRHQTIDNVIDGKVSKCSLIDNNINILKYTIMTQSYETALAELENSRVELEALGAISEGETSYIT